MKCRSSDIKIYPPMGKNFFKRSRELLVPQIDKYPKVFVIEDTVDRKIPEGSELANMVAKVANMVTKIANLALPPRVCQALIESPL
ncbi:hypothetical protein TNCV_3021091 [Trichonephila clavipes]|nr:hypothetical protein TNCV_3021091 [Trichonephila clavipes]